MRGFVELYQFLLIVLDGFIERLENLNGVEEPLHCVLGDFNVLLQLDLVVHGVD